MDAFSTFISAVQNYIDPAMLGAVLFLWFIGWCLKQTPAVPNWSILWIIVVLGTVAGLAIVGLDVNGVIQGVLAAALSIFGHQAVKQTANGVNNLKQ